jgi:lipoprotein NlpD
MNAALQRAALSLAVAAFLAAGCATRAPAPVDDRRPAPAPQSRPPVLQQAPVPGAGAPGAARPGTYIVKRGDTLYSIALEHGADHREVAQWNRLEDPSKIRVGQELRVVPPEERPAVQVAGTRQPAPIESRPLDPRPAAVAPGAAGSGTRTGPLALRLPYSEQNLAALQRGEARAEPAKPEPAKPAASPAPAPVSAPAPAAPPAATAAERPADAIDFIWPAKGRVVAGFSEPRNKGVDIAANLGDPVVAAAAGRVIYVGSGIPGLGKFIVVRHEGGFNTVYAHNREILVKMDQNLTRGQKIAEVGSTDTDSPKLHFQIRKFGTPLDPLKYLPAP